MQKPFFKNQNSNQNVNLYQSIISNQSINQFKFNILENNLSNLK